MINFLIYKSKELIYIIYIIKCEGGCLKRANLANTHPQGFFQLQY